MRIEHARRQDELLQAMAEVIAGELGLSYVRIETNHPDWDELTATHGESVGTMFSCPLTYQGRPAGRCTVTGSRPGRLPTRRERRDLAAIAQHAGAVLHTARLLRDRRQALDRVLYAREQERRHLRRELHDRLGPILAAISLGLHTAHRMVTRDATEAEQLLLHLETELQSAIEEVRRLFETLRPPVLDQLGLVAAVREHIDLLATRLGPDGDGLHVDFEFSSAGDFAALPAVVEVATYRIVCEALTNVARHSSASRCSVHLQRGVALRVEVIDDGVGFPDAIGRGVGVGSMRERAAQLGGSLVIKTLTAGGTSVVAILPLYPIPAAL
ncbi:MAG: sensor histidine kinase [Jatrophihabitans sp.]